MPSAYRVDLGDKVWPVSAEDVSGFKGGLLSAQVEIELDHCASLLCECEGLCSFAYECFRACRQMLKNPLVRRVLAARSHHGLFDWRRGFAKFALCDAGSVRPCCECDPSELKATMGDMRTTLGMLCAEMSREVAPQEQLEAVLALETEIRGFRDRALRTARFYDGAYRALLGSRIMVLIRRLLGPNEDALPLCAEAHALPSLGGGFRQNPITKDLLEQLIAESDALPQSNGSLTKRACIQLGLVSDEFAYLNYRDYSDVRLVNMSNLEAMVASGMDVLLCTSCWYGLASTPDGVTTLMDFDGDAGVANLQTIVQRAREAAIPVLFQSFEDPPSYDRFLPVAQVSDAIFTTAIECIPDYGRDTGVSVIQQMGFGINPLIHNPIGTMRRYLASRETRRVLFAGAWYEKFTQRCLDTVMLFDGAISCEDVQFLCIDRNLGAGDPLRTFPIRYNAYLCEPVEYEKLQLLVKEFDWVLNLNSVTTSITMCARRVYELQASGALVISNYSEAVSHLFPSVFTVFTSDEVGRIIHGYTFDEQLSIQIEQIRDVLSHHTNAHRLSSMLECAGITLPLFEPMVHIVCNVDDQAVVEDIRQQTYERYVIVDEAHPPEADPGFVIEWDQVQGNPYYLEDLVNVFKYVDVDYACYSSRDDLAHAYDYAQNPSAPSGALKRLSAPPALGERGQLTGFSILPEQWGRDTSSCKKDLAVVVPYRGEFDALHKRMFRSLLRLTSFASMTIYVVDLREEDDRADRHVLGYLYRDYDNVRFMENDFSCVAEAIGEDHVIVFQPSYEAVGDGLSAMLALAKEPGVGGVVAKMRDACRAGASSSVSGDDPTVAIVRREDFRPSCKGEIDLIAEGHHIIQMDDVAVIRYGATSDQ